MLDVFIWMRILGGDDCINFCLATRKHFGRINDQFVR